MSTGAGKRAREDDVGGGGGGASGRLPLARAGDLGEAALLAALIANFGRQVYIVNRGCVDNNRYDNVVEYKSTVHSVHASRKAARAAFRAELERMFDSLAFDHGGQLPPRMEDFLRRPDDGNWLDAARAAGDVREPAELFKERVLRNRARVADPSDAAERAQRDAVDALMRGEEGAETHFNFDWAEPWSNDCIKLRCGGVNFFVDDPESVGWSFWMDEGDGEPAEYIEITSHAVAAPQPPLCR